MKKYGEKHIGFKYYIITENFGFKIEFNYNINTLSIYLFLSLNSKFLRL